MKSLKTTAMRLKMRTSNQDKSNMRLMGFLSLILLSFLSGQSFSQCPTTATITLYDSIYPCNAAPHVNNSRTELKLIDNVPGVNYTTTFIGSGEIVGGLTNSLGNGSKHTIGLIPQNGRYRVEANKTGCPMVLVEHQIAIPTDPSTTPSLIGEGDLYSGPATIKLQNSQDQTRYILTKDNVEDGSILIGNGGTLTFGSSYGAGNYKVKAWKCGGRNISFGNVNISSFTLNLPASEGFNATTFPQGWTDQYLQGNTGIQLLQSTLKPASPQEGSHFVNFAPLGSTNETRLISPRFSVSNTINITVEFYWYTENNPSFTSSTEGVGFQYSPDGTTWNQAEFFSRHNPALPAGTGAWVKKTIGLSALVSNWQNLYIGFRFRSGANYNLSLDNFQISGTYIPPGCPQSVQLRDIKLCTENLNNGGTRTELIVQNDLLGVNYTTTLNGVPKGGNTGSGDGQGNGNGVSVGFLQETGTYSVRAEKQGCPVIDDATQYINIPVVSQTPTLVGEGGCTNTPTKLILKNSESYTTYILQKDGQAAWNTEYSGNGGDINFGTISDPGTYSLKAWKCGSMTSIFGNVILTDQSNSMPIAQNFNTNSFIDCWKQETIYGSTPLNFSPYPLAQEGSAVSYASTGSARLISPKISTGPSSGYVEFYWRHENGYHAQTYTDAGVQVEYSTDGMSWTNAGTFVRLYDNFPGSDGKWVKKTIALPSSALNQPTLYIGFKFTSYQTYPQQGLALYMDNVLIRDATMAPLPVAVEYFKGKKTGSDINLNWKVNCDNSSSTVKFDVERSANGRLFSSIHSFTATTARCDQPFDFTDRNPQKGINYYRIRIAEDNGKKTYTSIVPVANNDKGFELVSLMPSPTKGLSNLNISAAERTKFDLVVYDMQGRTVQKMRKSLEAGSNTIPVNFSSLSGGVYRLNGYAPDGTVKTLVFVKE